MDNQSARRILNHIALSSTLLILLMAVTTCTTQTQPGSTERLSGGHTGIVFYSERDGVENQGALYYLDPATGEEHRLTGSDETVTLYTDFSWSPQNRRLAYVSDLAGSPEIYAVDITGQDRQRLTHNQLWERLAVWSPDGSQVAFIGAGMSIDDAASRAYMMNADGSGLRQVVRDPSVLSGEVVWSPDGQQMALTVGSAEPDWRPVADILILDVRSGKEVLRIADGSDHFSLHWSHDGTRLAFFSVQDGQFRPFVADLATGQQTKITEIGVIGAVDWSPDDQQIAFTGLTEGESNYIDLYVANWDGTGLVNLTARPAIDTGGIWSPDGRELLFVSSESSEENEAEICVIEVETRTIRRITNNDFFDAMPLWKEW